MLKKKDLRYIFLCILGSFIYCCGVNFFIVPLDCFSGGFVGISQLISLLFNGTWLSQYNLRGIIYFIINIPLFILGLKKLGKQFIEKSIIVIIVESIFLTLIPIPQTPLISDSLTGIICGGCIEGLGCALTFRGFGSGGGTDILGLLLAKKKKNLSVGKVSFAINIFVYAICAYLFSLETAIYSFMASIFCSLITDKLHLQNNSVAVNVLSEKYNEISEMILSVLNRDATILEATGAYSGNNKKLVISIMSEYDLNVLKKEIAKIDKNAFIFIQPQISVMGNFEKRLSKEN